METGKELTVVYAWEYVILSLIFSCGGEYCAVNVVELLRKEYRWKNRLILMLMASWMIGGVCIWFLHFTGMFAMSLFYEDDNGQVVELELSLVVWETVMSYFLGILLIFAGMFIASKDDFFGTSHEKLQVLFANMIDLRRTNAKRAKRKIELIGLFGKPQYLIMGGTIAGFGVCCMHYIGMDAVHKDVDIEWNVGIIVASVLIATIVASVGFWILFRLLQWNQTSEWLRCASSIVIAIAVGAMHYTGAAAATFSLNEDLLLNDTVSNTGTISRTRMFHFGTFLSAVTIFVVLNFAIYYQRAIVNVDASEDMVRLLKKLNHILNRASNLEGLRTQINNSIMGDLYLSSKSRTRLSMQGNTTKVLPISPNLVSPTSPKADQVRTPVGTGASAAQAVHHESAAEIGGGSLLAGSELYDANMP